MTSRAVCRTGKSNKSLVYVERRASGAAVSQRKLSLGVCLKRTRLNAVTTRQETTKRQHERMYGDRVREKKPHRLPGKYERNNKVIVFNENIEKYYR